MGHGWRIIPRSGQVRANSQGDLHGFGFVARLEAQTAVFVAALILPIFWNRKLLIEQSKRSVKIDSLPIFGCGKVDEHEFEAVGGEKVAP